MINNNDKRARAQTIMENRTETVYIKDIHVGMKNITLTCIVLEVGPPVTLKENHEVRTVKVADQTACINLAVWNDAGHFINTSDILRMTKLYATLYRNSLTLYTSKVGTVEKIGEFCMVFNDQLNMSEIVQTPTQPPSNNPPSGNNTTNTNSSFMSRNSAVPTNSHAGPPHIASGSSRYDTSVRSNNSRNGHQSDDSSTVSSRNRTERR